MAELMKAYELNPNAGAFLLGRAYWQKGMYEEALRWWDSITTTEAPSFDTFRSPHRIVAVTPAPHGGQS